MGAYHFSGFPGCLLLLPSALAALAALSVLLEHVYETMLIKYGDDREPLDLTLETDHLLLEWARKNEDDFVTLDELLTELDVQIDEPK